MATSPPDEGRDTRLDALARLVPAATHDLSNVLTVLSGMVELLDRAGDGGPTGFGSEGASEQTQRARGLLEQLSTLAKPPGGGAVTVDARDALAASLPLVEALARELSVAVDVDPGGVLVVRADERELVHALTARLLAGIEAAARGAEPRRVRAALRTDGERARFVVEHGGGVDELSLDALAVESGTQSGAVRADADAARVLLYEPESLLAELARDVLHESGFEVDVAADAGRVDTLLAEGAYAALLVDADVERQEPGAIARLTSGAPAVGVLADEGDTTPDGHPCLRKPFRPKALVEFVRALVG